MLHVLQNPIPFVLVDDTNDELMNKYQYQIDDNEQTIYVMLASIPPTLQRQYENIDVHIYISKIYLMSLVVLKGMWLLGNCFITRWRRFFHWYSWSIYNWKISFYFT